MMCLTPNLLQKAAHVEDENWAPLSEVRVSGTPKRVTQCKKKTSTQEAAEVSFRGMASSQRVVRSIMVNRYT
jgi:hypothetical protein